MSKSDFLENGFLNLVFKGTTITGIADNTATSPLTSLYVSLHTADPTDSGTQSSSEVTYTSYARVAVARGAGWTTSTVGSTSPAANIDFPAGTGGSGTATYMGIGVASSGATNLLYSGTVTPNIVTGTGIQPRLTTATTITED